MLEQEHLVEQRRSKTVNWRVEKFLVMLRVTPLHQIMRHGVRPGRSLGLLIGLLIVLCSFLLSAVGFGAEEPEKFLTQLRERGYFDTASDYLEFIATTDLVDDAFKESIPFEQAITLKERAARTGDRLKQEQLLSDAVTAFQEFATAHPDSIRAADVRMEVANVYSIMARLTMGQAKRDGVDRKPLEQKAANIIRTQWLKW